MAMAVLPATAVLAASGIQKRTYMFREAGKEMGYALFVPEAYTKGKKWPLITEKSKPGER